MLEFDSLPIHLNLSHISSSYFLVYGRMFTNEPRTEPDDFEPSTDIISKAEFRLGEDGQVSMLGLLLEPEMGEKKIWFVREGGVVGHSYDTLWNSDPMSERIKDREDVDAAVNNAAWSSLFSPRLRMGIAPFFV